LVEDYSLEVTDLLINKNEGVALTRVFTLLLDDGKESSTSVKNLILKGFLSTL
jgi:hypothetical protein